MGWRIKEWADCDGSKYADLHVIDLKALSRNDPTIAAAGRTRRPVVLRRCRCGGCCSGSLLIAFLSWALNCFAAIPLSLCCIQTHGRRFLLARPRFYWAFLRVVCSIPCHLSYGLGHHVILLAPDHSPFARDASAFASVAYPSYLI
jgi:hypothetical protein